MELPGIPGNSVAYPGIFPGGICPTGVGFGMSVQCQTRREGKANGIPEKGWECGGSVGYGGGKGKLMVFGMGMFGMKGNPWKRSRILGEGAEALENEQNPWRIWGFRDLST